MPRRSIRLVMAILGTLALSFLLLTSHPLALLGFAPARPEESVEHLIPDKVQHAVAYAILTGLILIAFGRPSRRALVWSGLLAFAHGAASESLQHFVPDRTPDWRDLIANSAGIAATLLLAAAVGRRRRRARAAATVASDSRPDTDRGPKDGYARKLPMLPLVKNYGKPAALLLVVLAAGAVGLWSVRQWQLGRSQEHLLTRAEELQADGNHTEALPLLERYVGLFPHDAAGRAAYARALDQTVTAAKAGLKGRTRVFMTYAEAIREGATDPALRRRMVEVAIEIGRGSDALKQLELLRKETPDDAWISYQEGRCHEMTGEFQAAANSYRKALTLEPGNVDAADSLARLLAARLDDVDRAARVLDAIVKARPESPKAWIARARFRRERRDWKAAGEDLAEAARLDPENSAVVVAKADVALAQAAVERQRGGGESSRTLLEAASTDLARAAELTPRDAAIWLKAADVAESVSGIDAAIALLERGREANPGDVRIEARLADRLLAAGQNDEARRLLDDLPKDAGPLRLYFEGRLRMGEKNWQAARDALEAALREAAGSPDLANHIALHLAECCRQLGDDALEMAAYRRVLRNDPRSEPARLGIAAAAARKGKPDDAILEYRQLVHRPEVRPLLARLLIDRNERLPSEARDWREVDQLLAALAADSATAGDAAPLEARVAVLRAGAPPLGPPEAVVGKEQPTAAVLKELASHIDKGEFDDAAKVWGAARRRVPFGSQAELNAGYASLLIRKGQTDAAAQPLDLVERAEPDAFRTLVLRSTWFIERRECSQAHRLLESLSDQKTGDDPSLRDAVAATLASLLVDHLERTPPAASRPRERFTGKSTQPATPGRPRAAVTRIGQATDNRAQPAARSKEADAGCSELRTAAIELLRRAIQQHPERLLPLAGFLASLGPAAHPLDFSPDVWDSYHRELTERPSSIIVHFSSLRLPQIERIEAAAAEAVRRDLKSTGLRIGIGDLEGLLGRYDVAEKWYRSVFDVDPEHHLAMNNLAWLLALQKKSPQEALTLINRAIAVWGDEPRLLDTRGCVYTALNEPQKAIRDLERSLRARPGAVTALHLAQARSEAKNRTGAAQAIRVMLGEGVKAEQLHPLERTTFERLQKELATELAAEPE